LADESLKRGISKHIMGTFSKWLLHEDQKEVFDSLYATALSIVFLALSVLLLWPLGKGWMVYSLAKGYWIFWIALPVTAIPLILFRRIFRIDIYSNFDAYVISALVVSGFLVVGWSAFAALTVWRFAADTSVWVTAILFVVGLLSTQVALASVNPYYGGQIYRYVNLPLSAISFILFSLWPAAARALYGWFFDLF
jgi:hypothetical protein